jgi:hypothetical protein
MQDCRTGLENDASEPIYCAQFHELKQAVEEDPLGIGENVTQEQIAIT